jgi:hypothetical protein
MADLSLAQVIARIEEKVAILRRDLAKPVVLGDESFAEQDRYDLQVFDACLILLRQQQEPGWQAKLQAARKCRSGGSHYCPNCDRDFDSILWEILPSPPSDSEAI